MLLDCNGVVLIVSYRQLPVIITELLIMHCCSRPARFRPARFRPAESVYVGRTYAFPPPNG